MANELLTRDDIVRGKKNFDAQNLYMTGTAEEQVTLPDGQKIKTRAGMEKAITDKFPDSKAGLRNVGTDVGEVAVMTRSGVANTGLGSSRGQTLKSNELNDLFRSGVFTMIESSDDQNLPEGWYRNNGGSVLVLPYSESQSMQILVRKHLSSYAPEIFLRTIMGGESPEQTPWARIYHSSEKKTYTTTTATSANTVVTSTGELQRSTSSAIFKKDIANITIPDYRASLKAMRPVSYRSTDATSDRTDWSWYSFIAEEVASIDPRLAQMDSVEFFEDTDEDGNPFINSRELPEGEYAANGINTNGIVALIVHINQKMLGDIEKLEDEKTQLKRRMTNLEKRLDALDGPAAAE